MTDLFAHARMHALYRILNTPESVWPHAHSVVEDVFPAEFYAEIRAHMPADGDYTPLAQTGKVAKGDYEMRAGFLLDDRHLTRTTPRIADFWTRLFGDVFNEEFTEAIVGLHEKRIQSRFEREGKSRPQSFLKDMILVRDGSSDGVKIHTSDSKNVVTLLFYLPPDDRYVECGTTLYAPKEREFRCWGGTHYDFDRFDKVATVPYRANSLYMFVKDDDSFHGVEPIKIDDLRRDLLLFYIHR